MTANESLEYLKAIQAERKRYAAQNSAKRQRLIAAIGGVICLGCLLIISNMDMAVLWYLTGSIDLCTLPARGC